MKNFKPTDMKKLFFCLATLPIVSSSIAALGTYHDTQGDNENSIRLEEVAY